VWYSQIKGYSGSVFSGPFKIIKEFMTYPSYVPEAICPKCAFPVHQMFRQYYDGAHDILENKEVKKCKILGEHLHLECACGYEFVFRPLDWKGETPKKVKKIKVGK